MLKHEPEHYVWYKCAISAKVSRKINGLKETDPVAEREPWYKISWISSLNQNCFVVYYDSVPTQYNGYLVTFNEVKPYKEKIEYDWID